MLKEVQSWMEFYGWENGGRPGSAKRDAKGRQIASHGDETWNGDVSDAIVTIDRLANLKK